MNDTPVARDSKPLDHPMGTHTAAAVFGATLDPIIVLGAIRSEAGQIVDFEYLDANPAACDYVGMPHDDFVGQRMLELFPAVRDGLLARYIRVVETGEPLALDGQVYSSELLGGQERFYDIRATRLGDGLFYSWRDVTDRHEAALVVARSEESFRLLAENTADIVMVMRDGLIAWVSPSVEAAFGVTPEDVQGSPAFDFVHPDDLPEVSSRVQAALAGEPSRFRARFIAPSGVEHWVEVFAKPFIESDGRVGGMITSCQVIDDVMEIEAELDRRARFDSLTGLLNRSEILRTVTQVASRTPRSGDMTAVLFCDIDHFKDINDEYGHAAGDEVLRTVGERVAATIRADDFAARIGGDELLILLSGVHSLDEAAQVAEKIRAVASQRIALDHGVGIAPQLSIGVTVLRPGETTDALVERADSAMYLAKRAGRNQVIAV